MTTDPLLRRSTRQTPQSEQARSDQIPNRAGGFVFGVDERTRVRRFLLIGTTGGTFYASERELTVENVELILAWARYRASELLDMVVDISTEGRAPRQQPGLFALAAIAKLAENEDDRKRAFDTLPKVARTGYTLQKWVAYAENLGGWGRGSRRAVANWYLHRDLDKLALQLVKYRQREGWSHRDLLRLSHPVTADEARNRVFRWVTQNDVAPDQLPSLIHAFIEAQRADQSQSRTIVDLIHRENLPWEALPDWSLRRPEVWEAMIDRGMPQTALMRQLPRLTRLGLLDAGGSWVDHVAMQLQDEKRIRRARIHPLNVLTAMRTYSQGRSVRGQSTWNPSAPILDALDAAFYAAYGNVEPTGQRMLLALDVSGSMGWASVGGLPITPREVAAALALVTANVESSYEIIGFTTDGRTSLSTRMVRPLAISPRQRLDDVVRYTARLPFGGTDCALPMLDAVKRNAKVDTFVVITDHETWAGPTHPYQALRQYREKSGIDAKLVVVGLTTTNITLAEPGDAGTLDVAGFSNAVPQLISDFARGLLA